MPVKIPVSESRRQEDVLLLLAGRHAIEGRDDPPRIHHADRARKARRLFADRTTTGALIAVKDPLTGDVSPATDPADRANSLGLAILNILPAPNALAAQSLGYNWITRSPASRTRASRTSSASTSGPPTRTPSALRCQKWWTKSGARSGGRVLAWGLVRTRYDFTSDDGKDGLHAASSARTW